MNTMNLPNLEGWQHNWPSQQNSLQNATELAPQEAGLGVAGQWQVVLNDWAPDSLASRAMTGSMSVVHGHPVDKVLEVT